MRDFIKNLQQEVKRLQVSLDLIAGLLKRFEPSHCVARRGPEGAGGAAEHEEGDTVSSVSCAD